MTAYVVDASVAVKWYLPEEHSQQATTLLAPDSTLWAPDLIYVEVGNVFWKRVQRGELDHERARMFLSDFLTSPLRIEDSPLLLEKAWDIATRHGRSVYDSLYLALADKLGVTMVTADLRLCNAMQGTALEQNLVWVGAGLHPHIPSKPE